LAAFNSKTTFSISASSVSIGFGVTAIFGCAISGFSTGDEITVFIGAASAFEGITGKTADRMAAMG
jgi:hypothetical protein